MLCVAFNRKGKGHLTLVGEGGEAGAKWVLEAPGGEGVLSYISFISMCRGKGYGF